MISKNSLCSVIQKNGNSYMLHGGLQWGIDDDRYGYFFSHRRFNAPNFLSTSP
jgi:hypothetical protein